MDMTARAALITALATMERTFTCSDGLKLVGQVYPSPSSSQKVLVLHGWLDNSASFWKLAPKLQENAHVVAVDLPGHGLSGHKSKDGCPQLLAEGAVYVAEVLRELEWTSVSLVGHSMGAAIALTYAAAFPEQVKRLVLLEGAGPLAKSSDETPRSLRAHIQKRIDGNQKLKAKIPRLYDSLEAATAVRQKSSTLMPGNQYISEEAARAIVSRAAIMDTHGKLSFAHDVRLTWPSMLYMTVSQVEALQRAVQCPTCLLLAEDGYPFEEDRLAKTKELLQPTLFKMLPGSHHFHADPGTADAVAENVNSFLTMN